MAQDWAQVVGAGIVAGTSIFNTAKSGQIATDTLNKQSEINDRSFAYNEALLAEKAQVTQKTILYVAGAATVLLALYLLLKPNTG